MPDDKSRNMLQEDAFNIQMFELGTIEQSHKEEIVDNKLEPNNSIKSSQNALNIAETKAVFESPTPAFGSNKKMNQQSLLPVGSISSLTPITGSNID